MQFRHFIIELLRQEVDVDLCTVTDGKTKRSSEAWCCRLSGLQASKVELAVERQDAIELWVVGAVWN